MYIYIYIYTYIYIYIYTHNYVYVMHLASFDCVGVWELSLVRVGWVAHRLDGVVVEVEAEGDTLVIGGLKTKKAIKH